MSDTIDDISRHLNIKSTVKLSTFILSKVTATNSKPLKISQHPRSILDYSKDSVNGFLICIQFLLVERHLTLHTHLPLKRIPCRHLRIKLAYGWESRCTVYLRITVYELNTCPLQTHRQSGPAKKVQKWVCCVITITSEVITALHCLFLARQPPSGPGPTSFTRFYRSHTTTHHSR
jgi:hypothetical protein